MRSDVGGPTAVAGPPAIVPCESLRADELVELTHAVRSSLLEKGEFLPSSWVEEAAQDLAAGRLRGWVLRATDPVGLAFFSLRPGRAYGHVHVTPGPEALPRATTLLELLRTRRSQPTQRLDVGLTGLTDPEEDAVRAMVGTGEEALLRYAMECRIPSEAPRVLFPAGIRMVPIRDVRPEALAQLDWTAFQGTPDETLVADTPADDRRVVEEILQGLLGRFLDEASVALLDEDGALAGLLLTAEQTPRRAIFLDLVVRPDLRRGGVGSALLRWGLRALGAFGYESVRLWVTEANRPARALYERFGFRVTGRALIYRVGAAPLGSAQAQRSR